MFRDSDEILFRSHDGATLFARDQNGVLHDVPAHGERASWRGDDRHRVLAAALDRYGLWADLSDDERAAARHDAETGCYPLDFDRLFERVLFHVDGEQLAECGVERFLAELTPALARFGLALEVTTVSSPHPGEDDADYVVALNGIHCTVWTHDEWHDAGDVWGKSVVRPLAVLNHLLADLSPVRAHTLYGGGNEGLLLIADPHVAAAMRSSGLFDEDNLPAQAR